MKRKRAEEKALAFSLGQVPVGVGDAKRLPPRAPCWKEPVWKPGADGKLTSSYGPLFPEIYFEEYVHESGETRKRLPRDEDGERVWGPGVEPIYCYCMEPYDEEKKPNMIQCSGEGCEFNWFHWKECLGIKRHPPATRDWYCPSCALGK